MSKRLAYDVLEDGYVDYLKNTRGFDEQGIRKLCSPIIKLIVDRDYTTEQFMQETYQSIYEFLTGQEYRTGPAKELRQAVNNYQGYVKLKEEKK